MSQLRSGPAAAACLLALLPGLAASQDAPPAAASAAQRHEAPQQPAPPQLLAPVRVEVVRLEVVVTDKKGRPRPGLTRNDFTVLEDGKPQPIVQFQAFTRSAAAKPDDATPAPAATQDGAEEAQLPARYVVLAIDDVHMDFANLGRLQKAMARFIREDLRPEDQVALVTTSGSGAVYQEFTPDREVLRQTLSRLSAQNRRAGWSGVPYLTEVHAELIERNDPLALDAAVQETMAAGQFQDAESAERFVRQKARMIVAEAAYSSRLTLETLEGLTRGLAGLSGRKAIFLISDGFLTSITQGSNMPYDIRRIADAATRSNVVIYALDTRGLVASPPIAPAWSPARPQFSSAGIVDAMNRRATEALSSAMNALAADTGGFLVEQSNDLRGGLKEILDDTEAYYVLAYEPSDAARDGRFRRIEVRLASVDGVRVRTRSGYFAPGARRAENEADPAALAARREEQRRAEMRTALFALAPLGAIPLQLSADYVSVERGVTQLVVSGRVDVSNLPFVEARGRRQATIEVVALVCDEAGAVLHTLPTERSSLDLDPGDFELLLRNGFPYQKTVPVPAGRYVVRFAAREDATGLLGSVRQTVQVPELVPGRFALSSLFLLKEDEDAEAPAASGAPPKLHNAQAQRLFANGDSLYAQIYAYNPRRDAEGHADVVSQAEILKGGELLGQAAPEPIEVGEAAAPPQPHTTRIRLGRFEPGDYELRLTVTDRLAGAMASQRVAFRID
jgi:VWFA-related protein